MRSAPTYSFMLLIMQSHSKARRNAEMLPVPVSGSCTKRYTVRDFGFAQVPPSNPESASLPSLWINLLVRLDNTEKAAAAIEEQQAWIVVPL